MHRTHLVPRLLFWGLLMTLGSYAGAALAQPPQLPQPQLPAPGEEPMVGVLVIQREQTKRVQMSTKRKISQVQNENPRVARVQTLLDDPTTILITGLGAGSTRITLTDENKVVEALDIRVLDDVDVQAAANRKRFIEMVRRVAPTAVVDVAIPGNNIIIVTGNVYNAEQVHLILDTARGVFGVGTNVVNGLVIGGVQQVELQVVVAQVNRTEARRLAINFFNNRPDWFLNSIITPPLSTATSLSTGITGAATSATQTGANIAFGILSGSNGFTGYINALRTEGVAKILAEPRVVTLSGRSANINSGGRIPLIQSSAGGGSTSSYEQFGTIVNFLPIVMGNGKIHLEVQTEISAPDAALGVNIATAGSVASAPGFRQRTAQVTAQMEDGQTLAIGGLIQRTIDGTATKVPLLGDLPYFGVFFRAMVYNEAEEELLILVTPRLVDPLACTQVPKYLVGRETRPPDDFELFLEGILEAPRGQRDVFPGCHYLPVHKTPGANLNFPCGDSPHPGCGFGILGGHGCGLGCGHGCGHGRGCTSCGSGVSGCRNGTCSGNATFPATAESAPISESISGVVPTSGMVQESSNPGWEVYTEPMPSGPPSSGAASGPSSSQLRPAPAPNGLQMTSPPSIEGPQ